MLKKRTTLVLITAIIAATAVFQPQAPARELYRNWKSDLDHEEILEIVGLVRSLDTSYVERQENVEKLVQRGRGRDRQLVREQLIKALSYSNPQIRQGVAEVMVRIGDSASYVGPLVDALVYESAYDVRIQFIRLLPAFLLEDEHLRREAIGLMDSDNYAISARISKLLREPPLKPDGKEEDPRRIRVRKTIIQALAGQLDPIGTVLGGLSIKKRQLATRRILEDLLQDHLGSDYATATQAWRGIRPNARIANIAYLDAVQQTAARVLADIGAVEISDEIYKLGQVNRTTARSSAIKALASLTAYAQEIWAEDEIRLSTGGRDVSESERVWRRQRQKDCVMTVLNGLNLAQELLADNKVNESVRIAAFRALGSSRSPKAVPVLFDWAVHKNLGFGDRPDICEALGEIGGADSVRALSQLATYKGYGETGTRRQREYRSVIEAMKALANIASRKGDSGGDIALEELLNILGDQRVIEGRPSLGKQALYLLQSHFKSGEETISHRYWQNARRAFLAKIPRPRISIKVGE